MQLLVCTKTAVSQTKLAGNKKMVCTFFANVHTIFKFHKLLVCLVKEKVHTKVCRKASLGCHTAYFFAL
jgi:hypothetical protein